MQEESIDFETIKDLHYFGLITKVVDRNYEAEEPQ